MNSAGASYNRSRIQFTETLDMKFKGSFYHPKFFDFDLLLGISPDQLKEANDAFPETKHKFHKDLLTEYYFNGELLKEKPLYSTFFLNRQKQEVNRDFFERQTNDTFAYGQQVGLKQSSLPMNLSFNHTENDITRSFRPNLFFKEDILDYQMRPQVPLLNEVQIDYTNDQFKRLEDDLSPQKGSINDITTSNIRRFGDNKQDDLSSYIHYYNLNGFTSSRDFSVNENLSLQHNDWLKSIYQYNFFDRSANQTDSKENDLRAGVRHQLFESLTSSFDVKGSVLHSTTFDENKEGFTLVEDYKKKVGPATLLLGFNFDFEHHTRDSVGSFFNVVGERHVLDDASIVLLNEFNVDVSTIVVSNNSGTITYTKDSDYSLISHENGRIEIKRVVGGNIANGNEIDVNYTVRNNPSFRYDQYQKGYRSGLNFFHEKFKIYQSFRQRNFSDTKGVENVILEKFDDSIIGSSMDCGWTNFTVEQEEYHSDLLPFKALRLNQNFQFRPIPMTELLFSARRDHMELNDGTRNLYDLRSTAIYHFSPSASYRLEAGQLWQKGGGFDERRRILRNAFRKQLSRLLMEMGYEYEMQHFINQDRINNYFYVNFKRDF